MYVFEIKSWLIANIDRLCKTVVLPRCKSKLLTKKYGKHSSSCAILLRGIYNLSRSALQRTKKKRKLKSKTEKARLRFRKKKNRLKRQQPKADLSETVHESFALLSQRIKSLAKRKLYTKYTHKEINEQVLYRWIELFIRVQRRKKNWVSCIKVEKYKVENF